jgi:hypothetical protein
MRTSRTSRTAPPSNAGLLVFAALVVAWVGWRCLPASEGAWFGAVAHYAGYAAAVAMVFPFLHVWQRDLLRRPRFGSMTFWLRLHVWLAFAAFGFLLLHCQGRAHSPLTVALLVLTWVGMISGTVGLYGQRWLYAAMARRKDVPAEVGWERLEPEREQLAADAEAAVKKYKKELDGAPEAVQKFLTAGRAFLDRPYRLELWPRAGGDDGPLGVNRYDQARVLATDAQRTVVQGIWEKVERRRGLDREHWLHTLGRLWLLFHGPAAYALLVLVVEHLLVSWWYAGF